MTNIIGPTILVSHLLLPVTSAFAENQTGERKSFVITRTDSPPIIDGRLDDPVWLEATALDDLHQTTPRYRERPSEDTVVRFLYDDQYLYVGADLRDREPGGITATQLIQGQRVGSDDRFWVALDSFNSRRNDYLFVVNPNGIRNEALRENNLRFIAEWDTIWHAESSVNGRGWATEIAIPFKSISFDPESESWGVNFGRWIIRKREFDVWSSNERMWWAAEAGEMTGIKGIQQGLGLDVVPSANLIQRRDLVAGGDELLFEPALDVFYKITPSLSAALTINTDFSTAEVDQQQVALDRFLLFFPEKRDFFLQDAGIFEFGNLSANGRPFFSRRIGLSAEGVPIDIAGGGKLTGRIGRFNIGMLGIRQEAHGEVGAKDLLVGRISANVLSESSLGLIVTHGDPTSSDSNTLLGADFLFRNSNGPFGQIVQGQAWFQQSDSPGLSAQNHAFGASVEIPNDRIRLRLAAHEIQENFTPALGFVNRTGIRQYESVFRYRTRPRSGRWREIDHQVNAVLVSDIDGQVLSREMRVRPVILRTHGDDVLFVEWGDIRERVTADFALFDRLAIPAGDYEFDRYRAEFSSGQQRPVSLVLSLQDGGFFGGDRLEKFVEFQWRPSANFFLGLGFRENVVELPSGNFTSRLASFRSDVAFNSRWSWSSLIQYDNTAEVLALNSRLRYEPNAGRELLLVLNHDFEITDDNSLISTSNDMVLKLFYTFRY